MSSSVDEETLALVFNSVNLVVLLGVRILNNCNSNDISAGTASLAEFFLGAHKYVRNVLVFAEKR